MRERPNRDELLAIARQVLKESLIPALPAEQRYNALMVANAMAIASRQYADDPTAELEKIQALLRDFPVECEAVDWSAPPETAIRQAMSQVIALIRSGRFDADATGALKGYLSLQVLQRVRESNPKALPG